MAVLFFINHIIYAKINHNTPESLSMPKCRNTPMIQKKKKESRKKTKSERCMFNKPAQLFVRGKMMVLVLKAKIDS